MPYIPAHAREELRYNGNPHTVGELNFVISTFCNDYLRRAGTSYRVVNDLIGVLECAKLELYRRIAAPYEDTKIAENGDVYDAPSR